MRVLSTLALIPFLALPLAAPAFADERTVTVTGEGVVEARPDQAVITLGVTTQGETAAAALAANSAALAAVLERMRAAGIAERDIQTSNLSINPNWTNYDSSPSPQIAGYIASNMVTVRVRMLDTLGSVLDAAVTDGANTLNGLTFGMSEPRPAQDEARRLAVADAIARATLLVVASGETLGKVVSITEGGTYDGPAPMFRAEKDAASPVPVAEGEIGVTSSVTVVFEIAD